MKKKQELKKIYYLTNMDGVVFHFNLEEEYKSYTHTQPHTILTLWLDPA